MVVARSSPLLPRFSPRRFPLIRLGRRHPAETRGTLRLHLA